MAKKKRGSKDKKEIVVQDPKQNIGNVLRFWGVWKGSWWRKNKLLAKLALIGLLLEVTVVVVMAYGLNDITLSLYTVISGIILLDALIILVYVTYLIFSQGKKKRLTKEEREAVNKKVKNIEWKKR